MTDDQRALDGLIDQIVASAMEYAAVAVREPVDSEHLTLWVDTYGQLQIPTSPDAALALMVRAALLGSGAAVTDVLLAAQEEHGLDAADMLASVARRRVQSEPDR